MDEDKLGIVLLMSIIVTIIGAIGIFIAPEITDERITVGDIPVYHASESDPKVFDITFKSTGVDKHPENITEIIDMIEKYDITNKYLYVEYPDRIDDGHVNMNMAVDQTVWLNETYDYNTGIVILWYKYYGNHRAHTWIDINNTIYIIDSTTNQWWLVDDHKNIWDNKYKIQYTTTLKGTELGKENSELTNGYY